MRGENLDVLPNIKPNRGSPPHARGKRESIQFGGSPCRITPACAGKTLVESIGLPYC